MIYRPLRERSPKNILQLVRDGLKATGYDEVSLLSLSTGDYSRIESLLGSIIDRHLEERVAVSLPSLRVETLTPTLIRRIQQVRQLARQTGQPVAILIDLPSEEIKKIATPRVYEGIMLVRQGKLKIVPGYDGVYGRISIFPKEGEAEKPVASDTQMKLF